VGQKNQFITLIQFSPQAKKKQSRSISVKLRKVNDFCLFTTLNAFLCGLFLK